MKKDSLITSLMRNAAYEQVSHLHDYQTNAIIQIVHDKAPSLLTSPAAIRLLAHTVGEQEFAWGSQRTVQVDQDEFPGQVLYFLSNADYHTIYQHRDVGLAYERLFVYAQLAYLGYARYGNPRLIDSQHDSLSGDAAHILNDPALTNRKGQLGNQLHTFLRPGMREIFHNRYIGGRVSAPEIEVKKAVLKEVSKKYTFSDSKK